MSFFLTNRPSLLFFAAILLTTGGCARPHSPSPLGPVALQHIQAQNPLAPGRPLRATRVHQTSQSSFHLVQVRTQEPPHRHQRHDLSVLVLEGEGTLVLGKKSHQLKKGDFVFIPRGTLHYFHNESSGVSTAWAVFSPPFDGKDIVLETP